MMAETDRSEMYSKDFFGSSDPDFNLAAAVETYEFFMNEPEVAKALLHMHAHEEVSKALITEPDLINDLIYKKYLDRRDVVKKTVLSGVVNKSMTDGTAEEISKVMDQIEKAVSNDYTTWERSQNVKGQRRDSGGRFVKMGTTKVDLPQGVGATGDAHKKYWDAQTASYDRVTQQKHGATPPTVKQSKALNTAHSAAYLQIADALKNLDPTELAMAKITYTNFQSDGTVGQPFTRTKVGTMPEDFLNAEEVGSGEVPSSIDWYIDTDSMGNGRYDILTGAGTNMIGDPVNHFMSQEAAMSTANMLSRSGPAMGEYSTARQKYDGEYGGGKYNNLAATANMIDAVGGDKLSPKGKAALAAAQYVGEHGAEAEKILGPTSRRAAYRYRGVEKKPDAKLERAALESARGATSTDQAREQLIHPKDVTEQVGLDFIHEDEHSPFIRYWQNQLPSTEYVQLHLDSGTTPPSQGVVFDAKGQIVTQAVGYGDDHYLPFNLKNLTRSNRGEWVRTRTMGGPTTEDIYAGLITGTRSITVVSHSGVYNIEFDESFRGGRRFNDKSKRMVRRYAQLLDTLDAESTTLQKIPPDRKEEIRNQVAVEIPGSGKASEAARFKRINELNEVEKQNPTPSIAQQSLWTSEFGQKYAEKLANNTGDTEMTWEGVKANLTIRMNANEMLTDDQAIDAVGATESFEKFKKMKEAEYRTSQKPLKLNGQGYYFALKALQEQFPYYIKRVEWYSADDEYGKDKGYVAQNFNRPKAAKEGFWDPDIEGVKGNIKSLSGGDTGKVSARNTNFQNYDARQRAKGSEAKPEDSDAPEVRTADSGGGSEGASTASNISPVFGVKFSGLTPNLNLGTSTAVGSQRLRAAYDASQDIAKVQFTYKDHEGNDIPTTLGSANFINLPTLTNITSVDLNDEATLDKIANELEKLLNADPSLRIPLVGGPNALLNEIKKDPQGVTLLSKYRAALVSSKLQAPQNVGDVNKTHVTWDFTAPGVDGADFLPGNQRTKDDYYQTMVTDPDIEAVRQRHMGDGSVTWANWFQGGMEEVKAANRAVAEIKQQTYREPTVAYANVTYSKDDVDDLASILQQDALGIMKYRQLLPHLPPRSDLFQREGIAPRNRGRALPTGNIPSGVPGSPRQAQTQAR